MRLEGQSAVVTGGGSGIGKAIARAPGVFNPFVQG